MAKQKAFHAEFIDEKRKTAATARKSSSQCYNCMCTRIERMTESVVCMRSSSVSFKVRFVFLLLLLFFFCKIHRPQQCCMCTHRTTPMWICTFNCAEQQQLKETKWASKRDDCMHVCMFSLDIERCVVLTRGWKIRTHTHDGTDVQWWNSNQHCLMIHVYAEF